jgi:ABC-type multidrug transport system ATPase subunit
MSDAAIYFSNITKRYGTAVALDRFSLRVAQGECIALAGVNGAGKTTLLKCLLDLLALDSGAIEIFGVSHTNTNSRSPVVFLPERFVPPYYLTARDFLNYMAKLDGGAFDEALVIDRFRALDLDITALDKPVRSLSKGMTQKLGLAACLLSNKRLLILDEPLSGLDPRARARVKAQIMELKREGKTVFFTSHALADIEELADTMAVLHNSQLKFHGTPGALRAKYSEAGATDLETAFLLCIEESAPE